MSLFSYNFLLRFFFFLFLFLCFLSCQNSFKEKIIDLQTNKNPLIEILEPQNDTVTYEDKVTLTLQTKNEQPIQSIEIKQENADQNIYGNWEVVGTETSYKKIDITLNLGLNIIKVRSENQEGLKIENSTPLRIYKYWKKKESLLFDITQIDVLKKDTDFYLIGGEYEATPEKSLLLKYNLTNGNSFLPWLKKAALRGASYLKDSTIYVLGGESSSELNIYSLTGEPQATLNNTETKICARYQAASTIIDDGSNIIIYQFGGYDYLGNLQSTVSKYNLTDNSCFVKDIGFNIIDAKAVSYNGNIYLFGGIKSGSYLDNVYQYNPTDHQLMNLSDDTDNKLLFKRSKFGITSFGENIFLLGGEDQNGNTLNKIELYNLETKQSRELKPLPKELKNMGFIKSDTNSVLLFGGENDSEKNNQVIEYFVGYEGVEE